MTFRRRVIPLPSGPPRRLLSPAEQVTMAPIIAAAREAGAAGVILIARSGAEITVSFPADDGAIASELD